MESAAEYKEQVGYIARRWAGARRGLETGYTGIADASITLLRELIADLPPGQYPVARQALQLAEDNMIQTFRHIAAGNSRVADIKHQAAGRALSAAGQAFSNATRSRRSMKAGLNNQTLTALSDRIAAAGSGLQTMRPQILRGGGAWYVKELIAEVTRAQAIFQNAAPNRWKDRIDRDLAQAVMSLRFLYANVSRQPDRGLHDLIVARNTLRDAAFLLRRAALELGGD